MKLMRVLVLLWVIGSQAFGGGSVFEALQQDYSKAHAPTVKEALGAWAGYCVHSHEPNQKWPAVYIHQGHIDSQTNLEALSQTYFWEKNNSIGYFSHFTWEQLNQYPPYVEWSKKEQWRPTEIANDSLTNRFELPNGGTVFRSVRVRETEFTQTVLLEIRRETSKTTEILSQCAFDNHIPKKTSSPNTYTVSMQTGPLSDVYTEIKFPFQDRRMNQLVIQKPQGEIIFLSRVQVTSDTGRVFSFQPIQFAQSDAVALEFPEAQKLHSVRFFVEGRVSNLWVYGLTSPSHRRLGALVR